MEHDTRLQCILKMIRKKRLKLNTSKLQVMFPEVASNRHHCSYHQLRPDLTKICTINSIEAPTNVKNLKCFVGMVNLNRFSPHLADLLESLCQMTNKDDEIEWEVPHQGYIHLDQTCNFRSKYTAILQSKGRYHPIDDVCKKCVEAVLIQKGK